MLANSGWGERSQELSPLFNNTILNRVKVIRSSVDRIQTVAFNFAVYYQIPASDYRYPRAAI